jgi:hypothetical protein
MLETQRPGLDDVRTELERTASAAERLIAALERLRMIDTPIVLSPEGEPALQRMRAKGQYRREAPIAPTAGRGVGCGLETGAS